ncbi:MAG: sulfatase-like hydrolase/transferase [Verrucomicrobiae bacterium]|nr:sulfatase-like hydrolase/transferase [Verrucomicrobiae bacterium]NNJ42422.1 sulfatase-like hydrolase/transferase [Akkermansiaceae bacterium]
MRLGETEDNDRFRWQHLLAWVGGILCAMVPFVGDWKIDSMQLSVRQGAGNFGFNLLIGTGLCTLGGIVGGYWWRLGKWWQGRLDTVMSVAAVVLFAVGVLACVSDFLHALFFPLVGGIGVMGWVLAFVYREKGPRRLGGKPSKQTSGFWDLIDWLGAKYPWNAAFFVLLFLVLIVNNLALVWGLDISVGAKLGVLLGRVCTQGCIVGIVCLLMEMTMRAAPKYFRWTPWLVLGLVPLLVIMDQLLGIMWNRSLLDVVNGLTSSGNLDLEVELATSGLDVGPVGAWLMVLGVFIVAMLVAGGCWLISRRFQMRISMVWVVGGMLVLWGGAIAEQGIGSRYKPVVAWQEEHKAFNLHLGMFAPPQGVGVYRLSFYSGLAESEIQVPELEDKPDVYIFMVESARGDAIRPDVAPFLSAFRDTECQMFDGTWSGSNATHLSWFSFFHSRVPVFWRDALEAIPDRERFQGALTLQQIKQAGYELEVRAVCNFDYKDFGLSNFGFGTQMLSVLEQVEKGSAFSDLNIGERERVTLDRLRQSVLNRPSGGGFYFTALDSPHYNYYWHNDFKPPFAEYDQDTRFPMNPTEDEVQRVVNRYWNSVAWVDSQIEAFCEFLKSHGRYDESIIIVTGDHGEEFQELGSWFHCSSLRPEQTQVPILIKWPISMGRGPAQKDVNHIDVIPTLMGALGLPEETRRGLAGRDLLTAGGDFTSISTTAYVGKSGETMVLRRAGYEAVFFWEQYWESRVPEEVILEYIVGPDGTKVKLADASAYAAELRRLFPDAFERFFKSLEVVGL